MTKVYIGGTFDLLHPGHIALFKKAKEEFGYVVVSLNTDAFVKRYKRKPIMSFEERKTMLEACKYVDEVIINSGDEDSKPAILSSGCGVILHGDDWSGHSLMKQMGLTFEFLKEHNIKMHYYPYTSNISSTDIIFRCQASPS